MPPRSKPKWGEMLKLRNAFKDKRYLLSVVNNVDKRMLTKFLKSMWNWYPNTYKSEWIRKFYISDDQIRRRVGKRNVAELTETEFLELKAFCMVRESIWYKFHLFNRQFRNRWKIKYGEDTEFDIEVVDHSHVDHSLKRSKSTFRKGTNYNKYRK